MHADSSPTEGQVSLWSEEMDRIVAGWARRFANRWYLELDDVKQECFLGLLLHARKTDGSEISPVLIYLVCRDQINRYRYSLRRMPSRTTLEPDAHVSASPPDADLVQDVRAAVDSLRPASASVIRERFMRFQSLQDLAEAWGMRHKGVVKRQYLAFAELRGGLESAYGPSECRIRQAPRPLESARLRSHRPSWSTKDWSDWGPIPNQRDD